MDAPGTAELLRRALPGAAIEVLDPADMPTLGIDADHLLDVCRVLRDAPEFQYAFLADVTAVDRLPAEPRFDVVYHLACLGEHFVTAGAPAPAAPSRLRLKVRIAWLIACKRSCEKHPRTDRGIAPPPRAGAHRRPTGG